MKSHRGHGKHARKNDGKARSSSESSVFSVSTVADILRSIHVTLVHPSTITRYVS